MPGLSYGRLQSSSATVLSGACAAGGVRGLTRTLCLEALQGIGGVEYRNTLILVQIEQVAIAGDDELGFSCERAGEHVVIFEACGSKGTGHDI